MAQVVDMQFDIIYDKKLTRLTVVVLCQGSGVRADNSSPASALCDKNLTD
jgi:hypothetical protein